MVLFFIVLLALSILGMLGLLALKRYETATGRVVMVGVRPAVGAFFKRTLFWVEKVFPTLAREWGEHLGQQARLHLQRSLAKSILALEHGLEKMLHIVREKTEAPHAEGEASAFLREVASHKKKLARRSAPEGRVPRRRTKKTE